jgi:hypothetical protein
MAKKRRAEDAYDLSWRTVQFALDTMKLFAQRARTDEGDPEMRGAAAALEDALEHIKNYYLPLVDRSRE